MIVRVSTTFKINIKPARFDYWGVGRTAPIAIMVTMQLDSIAIANDVASLRAESVSSVWILGRALDLCAYVRSGMGYSVGNFWHKNLVSGEFWCQHRHAKIPKFIDILTYRRHFADMSPTFPAKLELMVYQEDVWAFPRDLLYISWGRFGTK